MNSMLSYHDAGNSIAKKMSRGASLRKLCWEYLCDFAVKPLSL